MTRAPVQISADVLCAWHWIHRDPIRGNVTVAAIAEHTGLPPATVRHYLDTYHPDLPVDGKEPHDQPRPPADPWVP